VVNVITFGLAQSDIIKQNILHQCLEYSLKMFLKLVQLSVDFYSYLGPLKIAYFYITTSANAIAQKITGSTAIHAIVA
jgi:hypothetical protein